MTHCGEIKGLCRHWGRPRGSEEAARDKAAVQCASAAIAAPAVGPFMEQPGTKVPSDIREGEQEKPLASAIPPASVSASGRVAELADAADSKSAFLGSVGSSPTSATKAS